MYYTYLLKLSNNEIYVGFTTDLVNRVKEYQIKEWADMMLS